jgi:hypothetical protein
MVRSMNNFATGYLWFIALYLLSACDASSTPDPQVHNGDSHFAVNSANRISSGGFIGSRGGPSFNPLSWHKVDGDVLAYTDDVWGRRVKPRGIFQIPGGVGLLYNSKPPENYIGDGARTQTGSLAFTRNLVDWYDFPGNPVLSEIRHEWQGGDRVMPRAMLFDERNQQWVVYTGDAIGSYPGTRAVGVAFSRDLVNWMIHDQITMTIEDYATRVAPLSNRTAEEIIARGRVYASWAIYHDDRYYLSASGHLFASDEPEGPFEYYDGFQGDLLPRTLPVHWDGKWYTAFPGYWNGQAGIGLAVADDLMGPYQENSSNPIFSIETTSRARPMLIRYDGTWAVLYCHTYDNDTNRMSLRVALSGIHPDILRTPMSR